MRSAVFRAARLLTLSLALAALAAGFSGCMFARAAKPDPFAKFYDAMDTVEYFPFIRYELNRIENSAAMRDFFRALLRADRQVVTIVHAGDSHVHADAFTGVVRERLQAVLGSAGRGLVFPYAAVKTHAARDYSTTVLGAWSSNQSIFPPNGLPIGVIGAVAQTSLPQSSITISFNQGIQIEPGRVRMFCENDAASFDAALVTNTGEVRRSDCHVPAGGTPGLAGQSAGNDPGPPGFRIEKPFQSLVLRAERSSPAQRYFRLYGLSLENGRPGILYHAAGLNGARFSDFVHRQKRAPLQIKEMEPDLLVFDMGINEVYTFRDQPLVFEADVRKTIELARSERPGQNILLINLPEIYVGGMNLGLSERYTALMRRIAMETGCGFYDTYGISGGSGSMPLWYRSGLARSDMNHLTWKGYEVKGALFATAILRATAREARQD